jgi:hypothetical protein
MAKHLTERLIKTTKRPTEGYRIEWDDEVKGFGVCFTPGSTAFIYNYRTRGCRQRRHKIGDIPAYTVELASDRGEGPCRAVEQRSRSARPPSNETLCADL